MGRLWSWAEKIIEKMLDRGIALIYNYGVQKKYFLCTSGSVVEHRLAKARAAGSNPVSCFIFLPEISWIYKEFRAFVRLEVCVQLKTEGRPKL